MEFCLAELFKISETDPSFRNGFRAAPLMRFVREEDGFLSITNGGPRFFINMDNYDAYQRGIKHANALDLRLVYGFRGALYLSASLS